MLAFSSLTFPRGVRGRLPVERRCDRNVTSRGGFGGGLRRYGGSGGGDDEGGGNEDESKGLRWKQLGLMARNHGKDINWIPRDVVDAFVAARVSEEMVEKVLCVLEYPMVGMLARIWTGWRDRLVMNPRFPIVAMVEMAIGFTTKTLAEVRSRKEKFWREFDFYLSDVFLELVGDFALIWLLAPAAMFGAPAPPSSMKGALSRLPSHFLQRATEGRNFSQVQRLACIAVKSVQFGLVGFFSSVVGHSATKALVALRKRDAPSTGGESEVVLAPVLDNSLSWGGFMAISSTARYQLVNGIENRIVDVVLGGSLALSTMATFILRVGNNYVGSAHWLLWAKWTGVQ